MKTTHKALVVLAGTATLATASTAFAGHHRDDHHGWTHRRVVVVERHYVPVRPVVVRRVYVEEPVYVYPAPAYPVTYRSGPVLHPDLATVGGAVAGAVIGSRFGKGDGRTLTTATGAVLGGMIGSRF